MKKILIFQPKETLAPIGGQEGYLFNLSHALTQLDYNVDFIRYGVPTRKTSRKLPHRLIELLRAIKYSNTLKIHKSYDPTWLDYDVIHFHRTLDMYYYRSFLRQYKGKVVLTSHSPCAYHQEMINKLNKFDYRLLKKEINKLEEIDQYAFSRADYIVYPCAEAEEPYFHSWPRYREIRDPQKMRFILTGINQCTPEIPKDITREKYHLSDSDFVICYAGRHNKIKGYDNLIKIGMSAIKELDAKVIVAGKQGNIPAPQNPSWIEIGWTKNPYSIINSANVFILPNRETYFDISMLEALSLGKIILTTYTGGNKVFKKFKNAGIFYYTSPEEALQQLQYIKNLDSTTRLKLEKRNQEIFTENFTSEIFAKKYIELMESL